MKKFLMHVILVILAVITISVNMNVQAVETVGFKLNVTANKTTVKPRR